MTLPCSMVKHVLLVNRTNQLLCEPTPRSSLRKALWATGATVCQRLPYGYTAPMTKAMTKTDKPARLSAEDWAQAALDVVAESGVAAVAVEPLARRLGVTKGSFYWHYPSREALLEAALSRWEAYEQEEDGKSPR